jgi:hypothetical protein
MIRPSTPNPLLTREPELAERLATFRPIVQNMLLDKLAAVTLREPAFRVRECPHPLEDVKAAAQVLRVLTRDSWDQDDMTVLDACWRQAAHSALFSEEFEAERHRILNCVEAGRQQLLAPRGTAHRVLG